MSRYKVSDEITWNVNHKKGFQNYQKLVLLASTWFKDLKFTLSKRKATKRVHCLGKLKKLIRPTPFSLHYPLFTKNNFALKISQYELTV